MSGSIKANNTDIENLVKAGQRRDRGAFDELVRLYQKRAMQAAVRILGNAEDAAEAVQTGFVKAYLKIDKLRESGRFEGWLLRIITNAAISQLRAAKRRAETIKIVDCFEDKKVVPKARQQDAEHLKEAIQRAMLKLTRKEAKAISLFGFEDLSHKQVARIMGCSV